MNMKFGSLLSFILAMSYVYFHIIDIKNKKHALTKFLEALWGIMVVFACIIQAEFICKHIKIITITMVTIGVLRSQPTANDRYIAANRGNHGNHVHHGSIPESTPSFDKLALPDQVKELPIGDLTHHDNDSHQSSHAFNPENIDSVSTVSSSDNYPEIYDETEIQTEVDTGAEPSFVYQTIVSPLLSQDGSFSFNKAYYQIIKSVDDYSTSLTYSMRRLVEDTTGQGTLVVCKLGRTRVILNKAIRNLLESYTHWMKLGTSIEMPHCRMEVKEALEAFHIEVEKVSKDLATINLAETGGEEPLKNFQKLDTMLFLTMAALGGDDSENAESIDGYHNHDIAQNPEKYLQY